jgi:hypothetical protein
MRSRWMIARLLARLNLRFPALFLILLTVTVADLLIPDILPFVDEIVLAILTALFGLWRNRRETGPGRP